MSFKRAQTWMKEEGSAPKEERPKEGRPKEGRLKERRLKEGSIKLQFTN